MGAPKFRATCKKDGIEISEDMAAHAVQTFREINSEIMSFHYDLERACIEAVEHKGAITHCGRIRYRVNGSFLWCALPSGRNLCYCYPKIIDKVWVVKKNGDKTTMLYSLALEREAKGELRIESDPQKAVAYKGVNSYTKKWQDLDTYGGKLVENVTQAVARDLLAEGMLRVEKAAYLVILTVHDEIVSEVASSFGSLGEFEQIMAAVPDWARGCPIGVEGWRGERYRK
jgi:DNA polymerase